MLFTSFTSILLLAAHTAFAATTPLNPAASSDLKIKISTAFPQAEVFGIKLVNGYPTETVLSIDNNELEPVQVHLVGGALWSHNPSSGDSQLIRNLTSAVIKTEIPAGASETITYKFTTELHPQDLNLKLVALVADHSGALHHILAYDEVVSVVEAATSVFDPQIVFLYLILAGAFLGTSYFVYNTWITTLFPQKPAKKRSSGKDGSRATGSSRGSKKVNGATDQVSVVAADGPAVTSSSKAYDESWIPADLISRPQSKRTPSKKTKAAA